MRKILLPFCITVLTLVCCTKSPQQVSDGSSSETVIGKIVNSDGTPSSHTRVMIVPYDYDPIRSQQSESLTIHSDTTTVSGEYKIRVGGIGRYNVMAVGLSQGTRLLISNINVHEDSTIVQQGTLTAPGAIKVIVQKNMDTSNGYVYIPGTTIGKLLKTTAGFVILDSVPAGSDNAVYYGLIAGSNSLNLISDSITVFANDTAITTWAAWKFVRRCYLNTTVSGAGVSGTILHFPVLIRLSATNFDFTQAKKNGEDVRFIKPDGSLCAMEIEQWDSIAGLAAIWVNVDTIFGNNNAQYIKMLWGAMAAGTMSNSASVFDTANGFQGVWHLNEADKALALDATANHFDGTPSDTAPVNVTGAIGLCKRFNGTSSFFDMKNTASSKLSFPENGTYTVSAWVYADTLDNRFHAIVGKSDNQYFLKLKQYYPPNPMRWEFAEFHDKAGWQITDTIATAKEWKHLVGVRQGPNQYFYLDGILVGAGIQIKADSSARNTGDDVTIGKFLTYSSIDASFCPFKGMIDEVRISNVAQSADWIRLCYMNQKQLDILVQFR